MDDSDFTIEATDLSPITVVSEFEDKWLREIAKLTDAGSMAIQLSRGVPDPAEPIVSFDARSGRWWTGRYIGEITYGDGTLQVAPRFGIPQLQRWLSRIWGVRLLSTKGKYETSRLWLWELLARLWEARLLSGAKHGLPTKRFDEVHRGRTLRGRLDIRATAKEMGAGRGNLVSRSRERSVDQQIAAIILCAFEQLRNQLHHLGDHRSWLSPRAQNIAQELQSHHYGRVGDVVVEMRSPIRYTPITESYRPVVELSLALLKRRPMSSTTGGQSDVLGVLIDMAEVWELYVHHLLHSSLIECDVTHTGRRAENEAHLLRSVNSGTRLGGLKPDILLNSFSSSKLLAVLDAKYKSTTRTLERPHGIQREDLYQINAYVSALGSSEGSIAGGLIYPRGGEVAAISALQHASPWQSSRHDALVWFLGIDCLSQDVDSTGLTSGEVEFIHIVRNMLGMSSDFSIHQMSVGRA